jgi:SAM-dependent methyltransferase
MGRPPERISWAAGQLAPSARILEVGCGGGHALALICARFPDAEVAGIDRSALQAARARALNRVLIDQGRLRVEALALAEAPAALGTFDAVLAINVNAFWTAPAPSLASLSRLLRPGGRAFIVYEPPTASRLRDIRTQLTALLAEHGFQAEDVREAAFGASHCVCIVARAG